MVYTEGSPTQRRLETLWTVSEPALPVRLYPVKGPGMFRYCALSFCEELNTRNSGV